MLNDIVDGVTRTLDDLFPEYKIYTDEVAQGIEFPCFFVNVLEPSVKPLLGPRKFWSINLCIQFLMDPTRRMSREWNRVTELLTSGMEFVRLADGRTIHGTAMSARLDADSRVVSFFVNYNCFTCQAEAAEESMEEIKIH